MKIGVDARELVPGKAGKGWYVYHVLFGLVKIDQNNTYILYSDRKIDFPDNKKIQKIILPQAGLRWHVAMPKQLKKDKIDLYWAPTSPIVPALTNTPTVFSIHDLTNLLFPETHTPKGRIVEKIFLGRAIHKSKKILTISKSTRDDIVKFFPHASKKINVTYLGFDPTYRTYLKSETARTLNRLKLNPGYILSVGTLEPRKNLVTVLNSYAKLKSEIRAKTPLVIVGSKGWKFEPIFKKVAELELEKYVRFLGYLPTEDLAHVFASASVFLMPSLYEGFGIPALEAMASGVPVIVSNVSSLPEVVGKAGVLVDPLDSSAITRKIEKIFSDTKYTSELTKESLIQAKKFSWQQCASETLEVFESANKD